MAKYQDGEYISLFFDGHDPGWRLIKGWRDDSHCQQELNSEYGKDVKIVTRVHHKYGFWAIGTDEMGDPQHRLVEREEPGRGRFKITLAYVEGMHEGGLR